MVARWSSRPRLLVGAGLLLVAFGVGWWIGGLGCGGVSNVPTLDEFPYVVEIAHKKTGEPSYGGIEVRDRQIIAFLDTLFPDYRCEVQAEPPIAPKAEHYVLQFMLEKSGYAKRLVVWSDGNAEFWSGGRKTLRVQGSFRRMMEWLPVRRAIELVARPQTTDHVGQKILAAQREEFLRVVIDNAQHQVGNIRFWAIRDLLTLIELTASRTKRCAGGHPTYHRLDGFVNGPFPKDQPQISDIRKVAMQSLDGDVVRDATTILAYTADEATIDELARRLESSENWRTTADLVICLQACLGLPGFRKGGICGNSSRTEFDEFFEREEQRSNEARRQLLTWFANWKDLSKEQRLAWVVSAWRSELSRTPEEYESPYLGAQVDRFRNLLRLGPSMLPAVEAAQAQSSDLTERGKLGFCKAFWTSQSDVALVEELLSGNHHQQMIACDIIAVALDASWKDQLAGILRTNQPQPSEDVRSWVHLVDKAVETLVICHDAQALPLLKEIQPLGFDSVRYAIQHFEVPQGSW